MKDDIFAEDLRPLPSALGIIEEANNLEPSVPVMSGHFNYFTFNGLSMHTTCATENQNNHNRLEIQPGLSFNFIFQGHIDYSFAGQRYVLKPEPQPQCSAIVNNRPEILTRHMMAGMHIQKVNVYAERYWLESRCRNQVELETFQKIFDQQMVVSWTPSETTLETAKQLIVIGNQDNFADTLEAERQTLSLLSLCLTELMPKIKEQSQAPAPITENKTELKTQINQLLSECTTLSDIASALHMSERTLQRKFKQQYGLTAAHYVKVQRLERAKRLLVIDQLTVGEVAYQSGYNHSSNFTSAFKKEFGITPVSFIDTHSKR